MDNQFQCTIVIPTYNERDNVSALLTGIQTALPESRVLFVDDNSPDGTGKILDEMAEQHSGRVFVLHRTVKEGLGAAYVNGYRYALEKWPETNYFIQMDADFSHDPAYLGAMLALAEKADVVVGSRYVNGVSIVNWPLHRLFISKFGSSYAQLVTGLPVTDCTSGFKCFRAEALKAMRLEAIRSNGYVFQVETVFRAWMLGFTIRELPIIFYERTKGDSKLSLGIAFEAFRVVTTLGLSRLISRRKRAMEQES